MNIKYLVFTILFVVFQVDQILGDLCQTYADAASTLTNECGHTSLSPCSTIFQSIKSCGQFDNIVLTVVPGDYSIDQQGTFGTLTNQSVTVLNSGTTPVSIDLSLSSEPFINIVALSNYDTTTVTLTGITFKNGNQSYGSVINVTASWVNVEIKQCNFIGNGATNSGGSFSFSKSNNGIKSAISGNSTVSIVQSTFSSVSLGKIYGGVLYNTMDLIKFTIDQSTFTNITNIVSGGIAYFTMGYMTMTNTVITGSTSAAAFFLGSYSLSGNNEPLFVFQNVNFTQATAGVGFGIVSQSSLATFTNCNFHDNQNTTIILGYNAAMFIVNQCTFVNNINKSPSSSGGAIKSYSTAMLIKNSKFINNFAQTGGAIFINGTDVLIYSSTVIIQNTLFSNNSAATVGGAIAVDYNSISLFNVVFDSNTASNLTSGSSIFCFGDSDIDWTNGTFSNVQTSNQYNSLGLDCNGDYCNFQDSVKDKYYQCEVGSPSKKGLTGAQKAGIAIGIILGFILLVVIIIIILRRCKHHRKYRPIGL